MRNFLEKIKQTFYWEELYTNAKGESIVFGFKFLLKFLLLLSVSLCIILFILYLAFLNNIKGVSYNYIDTRFEDDLVISINEKTLSTNKTGPIYFSIPEDKKLNNFNEKNDFYDSKIRKNLFVLAPEEVFSDFSLIEKYDAYAVFTSKSLITQNQNSQFKTTLYDYQNTEITKGKVLSFLNKMFNMVLPIVIIFSIPIIFIMFIVFSFKYLFLLLFVSIFAFFVFKLQKIDISFKEIYRMGIYTLIPVSLIGIILFFLDINNTLISIIIMTIILLYVNKSFQKDHKESKLDIKDDIIN